MAELLGRVERFAVNGGGQQQIAGQAQVKFLLYQCFYRVFLCRVPLDQVFLEMLLEFKI
jgi:hypothetical protein